MVGRAGLTSILEADFAGTNFGDTPDFTDITQYVRGATPMQLVWGRQGWTAQVSAAIRTLQLKNPDGRFTPGLASGAYAPNVRRRNRIRYGMQIAYTGGLTFTDAGDYWTISGSTGIVDKGDHLEFTVGTWTDHDDHWEVDTTKTTIRFFDGYVSSWDAGYENNVYPICDVEAQDFLARINRFTPLRTMLDEEILRTAPFAYFPLNDPGPTAGDLMTAVSPLTAIGTVSWEAATGAVDDGVGGVYLPGAAELAWSSPVTAGCLSIFLSTKGATGDLLVTTTGSKLSLTAGQIGGVTVNDGALHHVVVTGTAVEVDGASAGTWGGGPVKALARNLNGILFGLAMWDTRPDDTDLAAFRDAVLTGFAGETTADRVARLLSYRPNFGLVTDVPQGTVGVQQTSGMTLQEALLQTSASEGGALWSDGLQQIVMRSRSRLFNPDVTLSLDVSKVSGGTRFRDGVEGLVNDVTVNRVGGATVRVIVPESFEQDGQVATSLDLIVETDLDALAMAGWIAGNGATEQVASPSLGIDLYRETDPAIVTSVLALQPLDVIELTGLPDTAPASTVRYMVQGGELTMSPQQVQVTLYTTALPLPVFSWDDPDLGWDSGAVWAP